MAQIAFVEDVIGAFQQQRRMRQEGDQPARRHGRAAGDVVAVAPPGDEVLDEAAGIGTGDGRVGGPHVAQPAEAVERFGPGIARRRGVEGRFTMAAQHPSGEGVVARIEIAGRGRVGGAQVMRSKEQAGGTAAAEGPELAGRADEVATGPPRRPSDRGLGQSPSLSPPAQIPRRLRVRARQCAARIPAPS